MRKLGKRSGRSWPALAGVFLIAAGEVAIAPFAAYAGPDAAPGGAHQHFDAHFSHNRYYFDRGYSVRVPPAGGPGELHGLDGGRYWFQGGNWYRWGGHAWFVAEAPVGLFVPWLPPYFTTVWWNGIPYYYANDTYYVWDNTRQEYQVVAPPAGASSTTQAPASDELFVYPKNGQSAEQQSRDLYECHRWAVGQSGFDPTVAGGGVAPEKAVEKRNDYFRARVSCLEGRGYSVK